MCSHIGFEEESILIENLRPIAISAISNLMKPWVKTLFYVKIRFLRLSFDGS